MGLAIVAHLALTCEVQNIAAECVTEDCKEVLPVGITENKYTESRNINIATSKVVKMSRVIQKVVESREQNEGVGARVRRSIGNSQLRNLDPFLMLDEFRVQKPAGFPDHPHRGFETVCCHQPFSYFIDIGA